MIGSITASAVLLIYTEDKTGDWHYIYGSDLNCFAWIAKHISDPNYRYKVIERHGSIARCKESCEELLRREGKNTQRTYNVHQHFIRSRETEFLKSKEVVLAKWRSNAGNRDEVVYFTRLCGTHYIRSDTHTYQSLRSYKKARDFFEAYTAN